MKHRYSYAVYIVLAHSFFLFLFSCNRANIPVQEVVTEEEFLPDYEFCGEMKTFNFLNIFGNDVGNIYISNDEEQVHISIKMITSWYLNKSFIYIGPIENVPKDPSGNPNPLNFPFYRLHIPNVDQFTFQIDFDDLESDNNIISVYAELIQKDDNGNELQMSTAWIDGIGFPNSETNAAYTSFVREECEGCSYGIDTTELLAGQNIPAGYLTFTNDADFLYINYHTTDGWYLNATKLYVGDLANLPVNGGGNPVLGQFPYQQGHEISTDEYTFQIPLTQITDCFIIAAYADVYKDDDGVVLSEGAWGFGTEFPDASSWGWYSDYCIKACE